MAKQLVEYTLEDGSSVYIEIEDEARRGGRQRLGGRGEAEEAAREGGAFREALDRIRPAAEEVVATFQDLKTPDEISLDLSLKVAGGANFFVFTSGSEATFKVSLKWTRKKEE